ncbi:MAG: hypothetical protein HC906_12565 [Bacteroidales bacterium]|nr:hypothetical protein [Bacteroidales bacterium]
MKVNIGFKQFIIILLIFNYSFVHAQTLPGTYTTTWLGNTFGGQTKWMQNYVLGMTVSPAGKVFTTSHWDEDHHERGIYQNGDMLGNLGGRGFAIGSSKTHIFVGEGTTIRMHDFDSKFIKTFNPGFEILSISANQTYIVAGTWDAVSVFNISTGSLVKTFSFPNLRAVSIDNNNNIWIIKNVFITKVDSHEKKYSFLQSGLTPEIIRYDINGNLLEGKITGENGWIPVCMAIDNTGKLMVGDDGVRRLIDFYDVSSPATPLLVNSFGTPGGPSGGVSGEYNPLKFFGIKGVGTDSIGNIYVGLCEESTVLRSLKPTGEMNWETVCALFVDNIMFDPESEGRVAYGKK